MNSRLILKLVYIPKNNLTSLVTFGNLRTLRNLKSIPLLTNNFSTTCLLFKTATKTATRELQKDKKKSSKLSNKSNNKLNSKPVNVKFKPTLDNNKTANLSNKQTTVNNTSTNIDKNHNNTPSDAVHPDILTNSPEYQNSPSPSLWTPQDTEMLPPAIKKGDETRFLPSFPLKKETYPTLMPNSFPSPRVSKNFSFRQLVQTLRDKPDGEYVLLYMSEPHRLYYLILYCISFVMLVYTLNMITWAESEAFKTHIYSKLDHGDKPFLIDLKEHLTYLDGLNFMKSTLIVTFVSSIAFSIIYLFAKAPGRLVKSISYISRGQLKNPLIQLVIEPPFPILSKNSQIITIPIQDVSLAKNTTAWTGEGFYGTSDKSSFMIFLWEKGQWFPWIVDRKGWYWGDGRLWDVLFGKKSITEAERGLTYDMKLRIKIAQMKQEKYDNMQELKKGRNSYFWWVFAPFSIIKKDIIWITSKIMSKIKSSSKSNKSDNKTNNKN